MARRVRDAALARRAADGWVDPAERGSGSLGSADE